MIENKLLTIKEAGHLLGCHPNTLRKWDKEGLLRAVRIGSRGDRRYRKEDVEKVMNRVSYVHGENEIKAVSEVRKNYFNEYASMIIERAGLDRSSVIVDVPCGAGEMSKVLSDRGVGRKYYLIDTNPNMIQEAQKNIAENSLCIVGDAANVGNLVAEKVDAVICLNGFHIYIQEKLEFLAGCYEILKENGVLIFDVSSKGVGDFKTREYLEAEEREFVRLAQEFGVEQKRPGWPTSRTINEYIDLTLGVGLKVSKTISVNTLMPVNVPIQETLSIPGRLRSWLPGLSDEQRAEIFKQSNSFAQQQTGIEVIEHNRVFIVAQKQ